MDNEDLGTMFLLILFLMLVFFLGAVSGYGANNDVEELCEQVAAFSTEKLYFKDDYCMIALDGTDMKVSDYYDELMEK